MQRLLQSLPGLQRSCLGMQHLLQACDGRFRCCLSMQHLLQVCDKICKCRLRMQQRCMFLKGESGVVLACSAWCRFLKGYTDVEGHEEPLELCWTSIGHESHLKLTNTGGSPCMPALAACEHGMVSGQANYKLDGQDITQVCLAVSAYAFSICECPRDILNVGQKLIMCRSRYTLLWTDLTSVV